MRLAASHALKALALPLPLVLAAACAPRTAPTPTPAHADSTAIRRDIAYLASDALEGRLAGTPGNDSAAAYIARRYAALRFRALTPGYFQPFDARSAADAHAGRTEGRPTRNVVAVLDGTDAALRNEYVVVGAHFDHLGRSAQFATDPENKDQIRNGADDNASGTAAVLELARLFARTPTRRSLVFVNFSAEELGVLGSRWYVEHPPVPLERTTAMVNFDMVGRLRGDSLIVYGTATATEMKAILDSVGAAASSPRMTVKGIGDGYGPSDQQSFYEKDIPVLHFFTNLHEDYHRATDDVEKINAAGEAKVVDLAAGVIRAIANRPARLVVVKTPPPPPTVAGEAGRQTYLGSVPDMAAGDIAGMRITGVRPGSPADSAGLKAGDVIVEFGGTVVKDLYSYTDALYSHKPGDVVKIVVLREGKRVELTATLGRRGG